MIDFLNYSHFLNVQIDFLLWLQNIRNCSSDIINHFFLLITTFGETFLITLISAIIYWCIDVVSGIYLFSLFSINLFFAQLLKMIACIYRPWILSDKIHPHELAMEHAKGYSFPSKHSIMATGILGGIAYILRHKIVLTLILLIILCVMFSRMWLGVHTPQDVTVGFLIGLILVLALKPLVNWCEQNKNRYLYILGIINIMIVLSLLFICYKAYPMDYVNGKLIVNPQNSIHTSIVRFGYILGLINGAFLSRRYFPFKTDVSAITKLLRGIFGFILLKFIFGIIDDDFWNVNQDYKITLCTLFICGFIITAVYPLIFSTIEKLQIKLKDKISD